MGHRPRSRAILVALALATTVGPAAAEDDPPEPDASLLAPDDAPVPDDAPPDDDAAPDDAPAPALDPAVAQAMAKKLVAGGDEFRTKGNYYTKRKKPDKATERYERALEAYAKAFELGGDPAVQIKMANVEEKLGRWVDAARHYAGFLAAVADPDPADKAEAEGRLEVVKEHLGVLTLTIAPEGAAVSIDGTALGTAPLTAPIYLAPGPHALEITADGYQPSTPQLEVDAGSEAERTFELEPVPAVIVDTPPPPPPRVVEPVALPPGPSKLPLILGGGVAVGLAGGAVATGLMALARHDVFVDASASPGRRELARTSGKDLALITDLMITGSVIAAGVTTYYYLKVYQPKARRAEQRRRERATQADEFAGRGRDPAAGPKLLVVPWVETSGPVTAGGLVLGGAL